MGLKQFTSQSVSIPDINFNGGLNSTAGPLSLKDNESSDLQNIDFSKFGSILKRNGFTALNTSAITNTPAIDGLHWFEFDSSGTLTRFLVNVSDGKLFKMDNLDGTWDDITGTLTITASNHVDFENFLNEVYMTNGNDLPWKWNGSGNGSVMTVPTNLTKAKFVKQFNNYLFLANVTVNSISHPSRFYWSNINNTGTWTDSDFIEVAKNDGQEITGLRVLADRLVVYKSRSIYNIHFTGDADIPFILPGGGKSNSAVGCVSGASIQELENGHAFLATDGIYFYDGVNSIKVSNKINDTFDGFNKTRFSNVVSLVQKNKNRYWLAFTKSGGSTHDTVIVWDYFNQGFSVYKGINVSSMAITYVNGIDERPYFGDYGGFVYRADTGNDDFPSNVQTAIDAFYFTNWRSYSELVDKKGIASTVVYFRIESNGTTLTLAYSYDLDENDQFSQTFSLGTSGDVYGIGVYGTATYAAEGGRIERRDLTGRGRVVRFKFANSTLNEPFRIDGLGTLAHLETNV